MALEIDAGNTADPKRILVVDDEEDIREILKGLLVSLGHQVETARDGADALSKLDQGFDLVLLDLMMPGMDGFEAAAIIRQQYSLQDLPIIMITGMVGREERVKAAEIGANDFIAKPFEMVEVRLRTDSLLRMKQMHDRLKLHKDELEAKVSKRTRALNKALEDMAESQRLLRHAHLETIQRLVIAAEFKDQDTANHIQRMSHYSALIARHAGVPASQVDMILHASPMHDIGKIGIPESILLKPGKLEPSEWKVMRRHTLIGADILEGSDSSMLQMGAEIAISHHEKWDGTGYPNGLSGEEIPIVGRICAIADVFDALTSERPYKPPFSNKKAREIIWQDRGNHFDADLVDIFFDHTSEVEEIQEEYSVSDNGHDPA